MGVADDEHRLIARYAAKLAGRTSYPGAKRLDLAAYPEESYAQRSAIARLEQRNRYSILLLLLIFSLPPHLPKSSQTLLSVLVEKALARY